MKLQAYKSYIIRVVGLSHHIYRPGDGHIGCAPGYAQSMAEAKRWINQDIAKVLDTLGL